jgi:flagellar motor switch protein FliN/FliY
MDQPLQSSGFSPAQILMQVEVPVSVSLGRTRMAMKDLLGLSHGSVVELDEHLNQEVEVRVNNCVIAYGELVAVEGNYGVRIARMAGDAVPPAGEPKTLSDGEGDQTIG